MLRWEFACLLATAACSGAPFVLEADGQSVAVDAAPRSSDTNNPAGHHPAMGPSLDDASPVVAVDAGHPARDSDTPIARATSDAGSALDGAPSVEAEAVTTPDAHADGGADDAVAEATNSTCINGVGCCQQWGCFTLPGVHGPTLACCRTFGPQPNVGGDCEPVPATGTCY